MDISVVVPLFNEEESIPELFAWIERVMNRRASETVVHCERDQIPTKLRKIPGSVLWL